MLAEIEEGLGWMTEPTLCEVPYRISVRGCCTTLPLPVAEGWRSVRTSTRRPWHPHEIRKRHRRFEKGRKAPSLPGGFRLTEGRLSGPRPPRRRVTGRIKPRSERIRAAAEGPVKSRLPRIIIYPAGTSPPGSSGRRRLRRRNTPGTAPEHTESTVRTVVWVWGLTAVKALMTTTRVPLPSCSVSPIRAWVSRIGFGSAAVSRPTPWTSST